jgi:hypothetical protein
MSGTVGRESHRNKTPRYTELLDCACVSQAHCADTDDVVRIAAYSSQSLATDEMHQHLGGKVRDR